MDKKSGNKLIIAILMVLFLAAAAFSLYQMLRWFSRASHGTVSASAESTGTEDTGERPEKKTGGVIICYGDSNTYGYDPMGGRYPEEDVWPSVLQSMLGEDYTVINEGLNGRTTIFGEGGESWRNGLTALPEVLEKDMPVDTIIFMLGTNDTLIDPMKSAEDIAAGMETLILKAVEITTENQGFVPEIIIAAPAAIKDVRGTYLDISDISVEVSEELADTYRELADRYGYRFVDATKAAEISDADHIHLTKEGHRQMAELMYDAITE